MFSLNNLARKGLNQRRFLKPPLKLGRASMYRAHKGQRDVMIYLWPNLRWIMLVIGCRYLTYIIYRISLTVM